jgi:hypothetical protein
MAGDPFRNEGGLACLVQGGPSRSPVRLRCSVPLDRLTWPSVVTSAHSSFRLRHPAGSEMINERIGRCILPHPVPTGRRLVIEAVTGHGRRQAGRRQTRDRSTCSKVSVTASRRRHPHEPARPCSASWTTMT